MAQVWGVYEGFKLYSSRGFGKFIINLDSKRVIRKILHQESNGDSVLALIYRICLLMGKHNVVKLEHTFREANCVAYVLAKDGHLLKTNCKVMKKLLNSSRIFFTRISLVHLEWQLCSFFSVFGLTRSCLSNKRS